MQTNRIRRGFRLTIAVVGAAGVNLALLGAVMMLNRAGQPPASPSDPAEVRYVVRSPSPQQQPETEQTEPEPQEQQPQRMEVDTPVTEPEPIQPQTIPMSMELPDPTVAPATVRVAVRQQPTERSAAESNRAQRDSSASRSSTGLSGPQQPVDAQAVDRPPREVSAPMPPYPRRALRRGSEGQVTLRLLIDARGRVKDAQLIQVDGPEAFGEAALDAVDRWRFEPAYHQGQRVPVWASKTIRFRIRG